MKPPYEITPKILSLVASISEKLGMTDAVHLHKPPATLRRKNRIRTIQSSLEIEGNTLTEEQVTALLENKRVIAPKEDILEVENAIRVYDAIGKFNPYNIKHLQEAHKILMAGLVDKPGVFRTKNVGIVKGTKVTHVAPGGAVVTGLLKDLFAYLKKDKDIPLIKSCVFHYEFEFIHPFADGNGRMGRLWQTVILMQQYPVFEYLPVEKLVKERQAKYYEALSLSDRQGASTPFIEFMLNVIADALDELLRTQNRSLTTADRIELYKEKVKDKDFGRKDYMLNYREISQATASRDLKWAVDKAILIREGDKRLARYRYG